MTNAISMDKKYRTVEGKSIRLLCVDRRAQLSTYPVIALIGAEQGTHSFTAEGRNVIHKNSRMDLVEISPYDDWEIDKKILVSNDNISWKRRYFASIDKDTGRPLTFPAGKTSWSNRWQRLLEWKYAKPYEE